MTIAAGTHLGRYKVSSQIGAGGMGEVYLAEDTELERTVALKILPADVARDEGRLQRFIREAKSVSALNHPNILTIYEVGETDGAPFIATEFIDGETLRDSLTNAEIKISEVLDTAVQVASALAAAHEAGIIHRDIKPENIMIRHDALVKVLDFGLAKLAEKSNTNSDAATLVNTEPGVVMGTVKYMSPEQVRGAQVDERTDIFSFGVVLYEMIAGRVPFEGDTSSDVIASIIAREPPSLARYVQGLPVELERIVTKALAKEREERYQTVKDLLIDLRKLRQRLEVEAELARLGPLDPSGRVVMTTGDAQAAIDTIKLPTALGTKEIETARRASSAEYLVSRIKNHKRGAALALAILFAVSAGLVYFAAGRGFWGSETVIDSIAVLPFANASADPNAEYLSDGISESIINNLSRLPDLRVMSRNAAFRYKGRETDALAVGRDLRVRAVLTGRVIQRGDDLYISTELVDARDNHQIWGAQYNRRFSEVFAVQEEISREISERLRLQLSGEEQKRLARRDTDNTAAYQAYLKGRYHWSKRTDEELKKGIEHFQQAIDIDPNYALAHVGVADSYLVLYSYGAHPPKETIPKAKEAARKALEIDDALAEAHTSLAYVLWEYDWNWPRAETEFKRAIELNPNYPTAHHWYGLYLASVGRFDEATRELKQAQELDPLSLIINTNAGMVHYFARQYDRSIERYQKTLEMDPNFITARAKLGWSYHLKGMHQEAISQFQKVMALTEDDTGMRGEVAYVQAASGNKAEARKVLDELILQSQREYVSPYFIASIYAALGEKDQAFAWLEKAYEDRSSWMVYLKVEPYLDNLRADPRFANMMRRAGLAP